MTSFAQDKTYKIGDYYDDGNGVLGYVFEVSDNGRHGKIVGIPIRRGTSLLEASYTELIKAGVPELRNEDGETLRRKLLWVNATSETDGMENTKKLYRAWGDLLSKYNFTGRRSLSEIQSSLEQSSLETTDSFDNQNMFNGWYLPAIDELESFYASVAQDDLNQLIKNDILNTGHLGNVGSDREKYWKDFMKIPMGFFWSSTQSTDKDYSRWLVLDMSDGQCFYSVDSNFRYWYILIHKF